MTAAPSAQRAPSAAPAMARRRPVRLLLRPAIGLGAVTLCAAVLAWRVRVVAHAPRVELAPRVAQLMYDRMLAQRIAAYAQRYGRPAYYLDSVDAHLDSAEQALVADLRTDLWGEPVGYYWNWCWFTLHTRAGTPRDLSPVPPESLPPGRRFAWQGEISEDYPWPPGVGRRDRCFGGR